MTRRTRYDHYHFFLLVVWSLSSSCLVSTARGFLAPHPFLASAATRIRSSDDIPSRGPRGGGSLSSTTTDSNVVTVPTKPIQGMKPGTSGLRKKVEVWQAIEPENEHYVENFIQALLTTAAAQNGKMPDTLIVAGDGRYYNAEAMQLICRVLAGNGVNHIWIPQHGIQSTPAVSAAIRRRKDASGNSAKGAIILTASHNPGGPGEDFGIKYNLELGQPAGEDFTDALYEASLVLSEFQTVQTDTEIVLSADVGTQFALTDSCTVTIIDPFAEYMEALKECFDFDALKAFCQKPDVSIVFDAMHGAGGPFARKVLCEELGLDEETCLLRCDPRPDFGQCHPDPNLTYAAELIRRMGLLPDASPNPDAVEVPTLGVANDGDGDRNLIAGAQCFVTPSDSLAIICDNWQAIPHFAKRGGPKGVARSMPSSAALDVVAAARDIPCFVTPTGWKFFGNLMSSQELFDQTDYTPFLCGEESFGTGSDHIREKDGLWALLAWMSILMHVNRDSAAGLVSVQDVVTKHWATYGRHMYCRYDYEGVDSDAANSVMDLIRKEFVEGEISALSQEEGDIQLTDAEEFAYTDPVDGSQTDKQGLILKFQYPTGDTARVVFRLSGTGSAGATIRVYLEKYETDSSKHGAVAANALESLAQRALTLVQLAELTGRDAPTVIT